MITLAVDVVSSCVKADIKPRSQSTSLCDLYIVDVNIFNFEHHITCHVSKLVLFVMFQN